MKDNTLSILSDVETLEPSTGTSSSPKNHLFWMRNYEKAIEEIQQGSHRCPDEPDYICCSIAFEYENYRQFDKTRGPVAKYGGKPDNDTAIYESRILL